MADPAAPAMPKGIGKMAIIVPVMLYARKLDSEDDDVVFLLRCSYAAMQVLCFCVLGYMFVLTLDVDKLEGSDKVVLVPPKPGPFDAPDAKKAYKKTTYGELYVEQVRALFGSSAMSIAMTCGLHYYKGMVMGLAIQSVMAPFTMWENPVFQKLIMKSKERVFDEKLESEFTSDMGTIEGEEDSSTSSSSNSSKTKKAIKNKSAASSSESTTSPIEDLILDTWDDGSSADLEPLMAKVTKANANQQTRENKWTPLMVACGLNTKSAKTAMKQLLAVGADAGVKDVEGWNALHWACFHGNTTAVETLMDKKGFNCGKQGLHDVKDLQGCTPLELAEKEGNKDVAKTLKAILGNLKKDN